MNQVIIMGRLTADPVLREKSTTKVASYTLAVDRFKRMLDKDAQADFISCRAFDKSAEFANNWLKKGMKILVRGHLQTGSYVNKEGQKVYTTDVIVETQEFCEGKDNNERAAVEAGKKPSNAEDVFLSIPTDPLADEGLPFA